MGKGSAFHFSSLMPNSGPSHVRGIINSSQNELTAALELLSLPWSVVPGVIAEWDQR